MIDYTTGMISRSEHELMKQSLAPATEFDGCGQNYLSRRAWTQIRKLVQSIGNTITSLRQDKAIADRSARPLDHRSA
jgi:hypothetical protein